jgi:hypothetical protein
VHVRLTLPINDLRPAAAGLVSKSSQRSDLGLLGRKSDGSSAVPEHPQSQVRTIQSGFRMSRLEKMCQRVW